MPVMQWLPSVRKVLMILIYSSLHWTPWSRSSPIQYANCVSERLFDVEWSSLLLVLAIETWKSVLKRLCNFIDSQLHRSPKDHTREMHSTCVAAYNTLVTLIIERPMLLDDNENLFKLSEIIELGISGAKAQVGCTSSERWVDFVIGSSQRKDCCTKRRKNIIPLLNVSPRQLSTWCSCFSSTRSAKSSITVFSSPSSFRQFCIWKMMSVGIG